MVASTVSNAGDAGFFSWLVVRGTNASAAATVRATHEVRRAERGVFIVSELERLSSNGANSGMIFYSGAAGHPGARYSGLGLRRRDRSPRLLDHARGLHGNSHR